MGAPSKDSLKGNVLHFHITAFTPPASLLKFTIESRILQKHKYLSRSCWSICLRRPWRCRLAGVGGVLRWSRFSVWMGQYFMLQSLNINCHSTFLARKSESFSVRTQGNSMKLSWGSFRQDTRKMFCPRGCWSTATGSPGPWPLQEASRRVWTTLLGTWCDSCGVLCRARFLAASFYLPIF